MRWLVKLELSAVALLTLVAAGCTKSGDATAPLYDSVKVERRAIVVAVEAAGTIEPVATVELKSKASGEILDMKAETGDEVAQGALLVKVDPRTAKNRRRTAATGGDAARAGPAQQARLREGGARAGHLEGAGRHGTGQRGKRPHRLE
jgi:multidrug efflux pump subunit AcrA (membrane-fusion protein)